jgi:uncharacterized membrane protein YqaE (UPF0057 family)
MKDNIPYPKFKFWQIMIAILIIPLSVVLACGIVYFAVIIANLIK